MPRNCGCGSSSKTLDQNRHSPYSTTGIRTMLRSSALSLSIVVIVAIAMGGFATPATWAQNADDDVHIKPRIQPRPAKDDIKDLEKEFSPHTKPMKSTVELVLVPVTITDPMNRLVTGLDKENFTVFEGKSQQEIKSFSSEDAPLSLGVIFDMSGTMAAKSERAREA